MFSFFSQQAYSMMNPDYAFVTHWAYAMLRASWHGGLAILVVWGLCRLLSRMPAGLKVWLWRLAFIKFLIALFWASPIDLPLLSTPAGKNRTPVRAAITATHQPKTVARASSGQSRSRAIIPRPPIEPPYLQLSLLAAWLLAVGAVIGQVVREARYIRRLRRHSQRVEDACLNASCLRLCRRLRLTCPPQILASESAERPMLIGLLRPAIVLPSSLISYPSSLISSRSMTVAARDYISHPSSLTTDLELILAHELAHLKRRDLLWGWLQTIVHTLFVFHPLLRLASEEWRLAHESACDESVLLKTNASVADYGSVLLRIAESRPPQPAPAMAVGAVESYGSLKRRLLAMALVGRHPGGRLTLQVSFLIALAFTTLVPWRVSAQTRGVWTSRAPMPTPRAYFSIAEVNGLPYAIGGYNGQEVASLEVYDPATDTWTTKAPMPTPRHGLAVGVINRIIYVAGGYQEGSGCLQTVEAYDPATDSWTTKSLMPIATQSQGAALNGKLYVIGGSSKGNASAAVQVYDPKTDSWTTKQPMPSARCHQAVIAHQGLVYVLGGTDTTGYITHATVEAYDPTSDAWITKPPMPTARALFGVGALNGLLYAIGGTSHGAAHSSVEVYDAESNAWNAETSIMAPRSNVAVAVAKGALYAIGGHSEAFLGTNEAFTLVERPQIRARSVSEENGTR